MSININDFVSCCVSGTVSSLLFHPIDSLRTKLFFGLTFKEINLKSLLNGIVFSTSTQIVKQCCTFPVQKYIKNNMPNSYSDTVNNIVSGSISGVFLSTVSTPINVIKIPLQHDNNNKVYGTVKDLYGKYGLKGFFRGYVGTSCRDVIWNGCYFPIFGYWNNKLDNRFAASSIAGCSALLVAYPFDGIRMYRQNNKSNYNFWHGFKAAFNTSKENQRSFLICFFRVPLAVSISHYTYMYCNDFLNQR